MSEDAKFHDNSIWNANRHRLDKYHNEKSYTGLEYDMGSISFDSSENVGDNHDLQSAREPMPTDLTTPFAGLSQPQLEIHTADAGVDKIETSSDEDDPPQSVIHAPAGFGDFGANGKLNGQVPFAGALAPSNAIKSHTSHIAAQFPTGHDSATAVVVGSNNTVSPPPLSTSIESAREWSERPTPRAHTRQEFDNPTIELNSRTADGREHAVSQGETPWILMSSMEGFKHFNEELEIDALKAALAECWALCNSLATLSCLYGERQGSQINVQDEAWKLCWRLCQELYVNQKDPDSSKVNITLDICHAFCQSLFEAREKENEMADSVLRVSFELNNHLFNTHDRNLPEAFGERTLDFYITLCHRLMKQKSFVSETETPLRACWSFAEMLFTMRQSQRGNKRPDEDLLGSAVQACWDLCDVFREGWTQRSHRSSDRGTPRPSQATFQQVIEKVNGPQYIDCEISRQLRNPETPTTVFDDTATMSPDEAPMQNIFVLGQDPGQASHAAWSSNSSAVSGQSRSSEQSSSAKTITTTLSGGLNLVFVKILVTKAAMNSGYQRSGTQSFSSFVKSLSSDAFGSLSWQISLLKNYKRLVALDPIFQAASYQARASAIDVAQAVRLIAHGGQHPWLLDLYRLVFGFQTDEAISRKEMVLQV
ncbi:uncharacterized protein BP01DRAFT_418126 [Aspergillus saccharolyticus JOP 1030-1]|uniref:DUF7624 domain-containing protein n=1 Tax=Aspergillus saccharolyticus JOP 1030-1 TaxID=1450539 RepID=A0A318Z4B8_9EURO|nr:hypothetical protein BP01DRAFT_418126 [Aspergillus saccharolyticus JOP 1030-1]PYH42165.1 hypothetical protein BP01DRAFT_418126 [Aspergillus saccharolyticus JOP 1030-1]